MEDVASRQPVLTLKIERRDRMRPDDGVTDAWRVGLEDVKDSCGEPGLLVVPGTAVELEGELLDSGRKDVLAGRGHRVVVH